MILRQFSRQQALLRPVSNYAKITPFILKPSQSRRAHSVAKLGNDLYWGQNGVEQSREDQERPARLYTKEGFKIAWKTYQAMLLNWINAHVKGTPDEFLSLQDIIFKYSRNPAKAALFNHASMAVNNEFYFSGLNHISTAPKMPLIQHIETSFSSLNSFKLEFIETANAMFGGGFVWLVQDRETEKMRILATYNAGTPYRQAHVRQQSVDMANSSDPPPGSGEYASAEEYRRLTEVQVGAGSFGRSHNEGKPAQSNEAGHMGYNCDPVMCVNVWQYAFFRDWALNKESFLNEWWKFIDWDVALARSSVVTRQLQKKKEKKHDSKTSKFGSTVQHTFNRLSS